MSSACNKPENYSFSKTQMPTNKEQQQSHETTLELNTSQAQFRCAMQHLQARRLELLQFCVPISTSHNATPKLQQNSRFETTSKGQNMLHCIPSSAMRTFWHVSPDSINPPNKEPGSRSLTTSERSHEVLLLALRRELMASTVFPVSSFCEDTHVYTWQSIRSSTQ